MNAIARPGPRLRRVLLSTVIAFAAAVPAKAQNDSGRAVTVVSGESAVVKIGTISHALALDESICRVEIDQTNLRLTGLSRGETVVLVWAGSDPVSLLVHVDAPLLELVQTGLTPRELDAIGHGTVGTLAHVGSSAAGDRSYSFLTPFSWTQGTPDRRFSINGQVQNALSSAAAVSNTDTVSAEWTTPTVRVYAADLAVALDGGAEARIAPSSPGTAIALRGAEVVVSQGKSTYELFAGATSPWFAGSRQLAGFNFQRAITARVKAYGSTGWLRVPDLVSDKVVGAQRSVFQTFGLSARLSQHAAAQMSVGVSSAGQYADGAVSWQSDRVSGLFNVRRSSPEFAFNQIQLLFAAADLVHGDVSWRVARRLAVGSTYQQSTIEPTPLVPARVQSRNGAATARLALPWQQTVFATYTLDANHGGLGAIADRTGRRLDAGVSSQFGRRVWNTAQVSIGALSDPLQLAASSDFTLHENVSIGFNRTTFNFGLSHERLNPSLVSRLNGELALLSPGLQSLFQNDPVGFVESPLMPPELRLLLQSFQPVETQFAASAQIVAGRRLTINPTYTFSHNAQSSLIASDSQTFGYSMTWLATRKWQIQSSLSQAIVFDVRRGAFTRTTIASAGVRYAFAGLPSWIAPSARSGAIRGRVFRDMNIDGHWNAGDTPLAGITVTLGAGRNAVTDARGLFEFTGLEPGEYRVSLPLQQFAHPVRLTTDIEQKVRLFENRRAEVEFGIVDFSRVLGKIFNDYASSGIREADAPGLRDVRFAIVGGGINREITAGSDGDFEVDDLPAGRYHVSVDPASIPVNYVAASSDPVEINVKPSTTTIVDVPVRAIRSISGRVFFREMNRDGGSATAAAEPVPLKGVTVEAHGRIAVTDEEGRFVLRDLPAGDTEVRIVPARALPSDLRAPAGLVRIPKDPVRIENAVITVGNSRLIEYLVPAAAETNPRR
jgi:hypothetical protein